MVYGKAIVIVNIYGPPATTYAAFSAFYDALTQTIGPLCVNNLCILCGDLNRINTRPFTLFGLHDIVNFPTRLGSQLDHIFCVR